MVLGPLWRHQKRQLTLQYLVTETSPETLQQGSLTLKIW